jgi:hypothetical protein
MNPTKPVRACMPLCVSLSELLSHVTVDGLDAAFCAEPFPCVAVNSRDLLRVREYVRARCAGWLCAVLSVCVCLDGTRSRST